MIARLWYAGLLFLCYPAVAIGLWPSLFTIGALVALPLGVVALIGVANPQYLAVRPRLLRAVRGGTYVVAAQLVYYMVWHASSERRHVTLVVHEPVPPALRLIYRVTDGDPPGSGWHRRFEMPPSGILHTSYAMDMGWYDPADPHPLTLLVVSAKGDTVERAAHWRNAGSASIDGCQFSYDEFAAGPAVQPGDAQQAGQSGIWMDSIPAWGVVCDNGRLRRARDGEQPRLPSLVWSCIYSQSGTMACGNREAPVTAPVAPPSGQPAPRGSPATSTPALR